MREKSRTNKDPNTRKHKHYHNNNTANKCISFFIYDRKYTDKYIDIVLFFFCFCFVHI